VSITHESPATASTTPATAAGTKPRPADDPKAKAAAGAQPEAEGEDEEEYEEEASVSRRTINLVTSCSVSTVVHFTLILAMGLITLPAIVKPKVQIIEASVTERPIEEVVERLETKIKPATAVNAVAGAASATVGVQGVALNPTAAAPKMNTIVAQEVTNVKVDVGAVNVFAATGSQYVAQVPTGTYGEAMGTADGINDAMDSLTREILNRLAKGKVLIVWVFDQSLSMKDEQQEIRDRIELVYKELDLSSQVKDDVLLTGIVSFGKGFAVHTPQPTNVIDDIKAAIDQVPVDESGEEMTCSALGQAAQMYRPFSVGGGNRSIMLVVVTDESGNQQDNLRALEPAIAVCKEAKASVYCIGREAVFSYPYAHMNWSVTVPAVQPGKTVTENFIVRVDRGPESPFVELLQTEGFRARQDAHPSGFGPYEQVRMARETGGMFLMLPSPEARVFRRDATKFDFEWMRPYLPDLRSREEYAQERDYNPMRAVIWKVINDLNPYKPEIAKYINLAYSFPADPGARSRAIDVELTKAKMYVEYLNAAEKAMRDNLRNRDREKSPRWRAHFDLILAQIIAYRARVYEYGVYLTAFKANPKPSDPPTPTRALRDWNVAERKRVFGGTLTQPDIDEATMRFTEIMREYPNTPWATRAKFELARGFGIELMAEYYNPNPKPDPNRPRPAKPIKRPTI
jgi:hypothetical protein